MVTSQMPHMAARSQLPWQMSYHRHRLYTTQQDRRTPQQMYYHRIASKERRTPQHDRSMTAAWPHDRMTAWPHDRIASKHRSKITSKERRTSQNIEASNQQAASISARLLAEQGL
jgi:hypothetical protein